MAAEHLLRVGRRQIAFLGEASDDCPEFKQRFEGYRQALSSAGLPARDELHRDADNQETSGYRAMQALLDSGEEVDGVVAASDLIAIGAMKCLRQAGIAIPGDVSVVGFDDIPAASYFTPSLTTVRQDTREAARILVKNLLAMIEGEEVQSRLLPMKLAIRGSCGGRET